MAVMSLGTFVFSIPTLLFDQFQQREGQRFATNARVGARDAVQAIGPDEETIRLDGLAVAELQDADGSLDQLRGMMEATGIWPLMDGNGRLYGYYVIRSLENRSRTFLAGGEKLAFEFGLDLLRVDDPEADAAS
ncbi:phage tail protein [Sphingomonas oryzagri]|uniref:Phage tail protein n=1 Tax=Sphingomonas oryzagri TaxID=3042314 RepID=A0ABT6N7U3_9SPHN|nr:phage tail protein [Sphingomonas oryzagri]MDH7641163.1 phage tail protein [Sphingomonas oryzagri]